MRSTVAIPRPRFPLGALLGLFLGGAAVLVALSGCGLESIPFIAGPIDDEIDVVQETARITFTHNDTENDTDEFEGYDLYYKLYRDEEAGCDEGEPCDEDRAYILDEPVRTGPNRLLGRSYLRMIYEPSPGEIPNIPVSDILKSDEFDVTLDLFSGSDEAQIDVIASWGSDERALKRNVVSEQTAANVYKSFLDVRDYDDEDEDLQELLDSEDDVVETTIEDVINNDNLYISVYALGFGTDPGSLQSLYSEPVFLGYVRIDPRTF